MAAEQTGDRGRPIFLQTGASADAEDLTLLGELITQLGTRRVGTSDERTSLDAIYRFEGLLWDDTSDGATYRWTNDGWRLWSSPSVAWTPRLAVTGLNIGAAGSITGEYAVANGRVFGSIRGRFAGANTAWGDIRFFAPQPVRSPYSLSPHVVGMIGMNDASSGGGPYISPMFVLPGADGGAATLRIARMGESGATATYTSGQPFPVSVNDTFGGEFSYPIQY
jgi:hypothetical protein